MKNLDSFFKALIEKTVEICFQKFIKDFLPKIDTKIIQADPKEEELLTPQETCKYLKIHETTLWRWTKDGRVICYGIGGSRFYKKSEILDALKPLKGSGDE